jgi:hypothetical protein
LGGWLHKYVAPCLFGRHEFGHKMRSRSTNCAILLKNKQLAEVLLALGGFAQRRAYFADTNGGIVYGDHVNDDWPEEQW